MPDSLFTTTPIPVTATGGLAKKDSENYTTWGSRYAGATNADKNVLTPALHQVILANKREQKGDEKQQEERKKEILKKIDAAKNDQTATEGIIKNKESDIDDLMSKIAEKKNEINQIKEGNQHRGMAEVNFWIGAIVTAALAVYLFIFYSSAAFSAFFRDSTNDVGDAIFYPYAFQDALSMSLGNFLLILFLPVIFIALGLIMHNYTKKEGRSRYAKIGVLYFITFCFDALLAFEISQKMYIPTPENPQYTMSMAFNSPNFWIIIFSGFIAYIIWGLVFDFTMENYEEMSSGALTIKRLEGEIESLNNSIDEIKKEISQLQEVINNLRKEITQLEHDRTAKVTYDLEKIKICLNEFFSGWLGYMTLVGQPDIDKDEATVIFDNVINSNSLTTEKE